MLRAVRAFEASGAAPPTVADAQHALARAHWALSEHDEARRVLDEAIVKLRADGAGSTEQLADAEALAASWAE